MRLHRRRRTTPSLGRKRWTRLLKLSVPMFVLGVFWTQIKLQQVTALLGHPDTLESQLEQQVASLTESNLELNKENERLKGVATKAQTKQGGLMMDMDLQALMKDDTDVSVWDLYYETKRHGFPAQLCSNATGTSTPAIRPMFREFCPDCLHSQCRAKAFAMTFKHKLYASVDEALLAMAKQEYESCCPIVHDKRILLSSQGLAQRSLSLPADINTAAYSDTLNTATISAIDDDSNNNRTDDYAWCVLNNVNNTPTVNWVAGLSHSAQALIPCWSYFSRVWELRPWARCGIWFQGGIAAEFQRHVDKDPEQHWVAGLMQGMNCTYAYSEDYNIPPPQVTLSSSWQYMYQPMNLQIHHFSAWFQYASDATRLQKQLLKLHYGEHNHVTTTYDTQDNKRPLRIGLVQRRGTARNITNLPEIQKEIQKEYPHAIVEWGEMEPLTFLQQVAFWNRYDVVVAAHGAAMTNVLFMRRNTAVVELFPLHYYVLMYRELAVRAGVYHFNWLDDTPFPEVDYFLHAGNRKVRYQLRGNSLTPPVDRILQLVREAVDATMRSQGSFILNPQ